MLKLALILLLPCSVFNFLEITQTSHFTAGHALQAMVRSDVTKRILFQEYFLQYPHRKGIVGCARRP